LAGPERRLTLDLSGHPQPHTRPTFVLATSKSVPSRRANVIRASSMWSGDGLLPHLDSPSRRLTSVSAVAAGSGQVCVFMDTSEPGKATQAPKTDLRPPGGTVHRPY